MKQFTIKNFYDELFDYFNDNCIKVDCLENFSRSDVLVIAVGVKEQITSLLSYLNRGAKKSSHIYIVVQKNMIPVVQDLKNEQCCFIEWNGPYTSDLVGRVEEQVDLGTVSHLFYQGRQPLNFRDINLYDILLEIKKKYESDHEMRIYVQDIQESVHWYKNPEKIRKGMDVYQAIDAYLEV